MKILLMVGSGGFLGSVLRYLISVNTTQKFLTMVPSGTLYVNVIGCFIIGLIFGFGERTEIPSSLRFFLTVGFCGGFTTFSAFSAETFSMLKSHMLGPAFIYVITSIVLSLAATFFGFLCFKYFT